jgi:hypothetical protein
VSVNVKIVWNEAEFARILEVETVPQAVWRAAGKVRDRAKANITAADRVDTGAMRAQLVGRRISGGAGGVWYEVGSPVPYAIYQHQGVQGPIYPRRAKVLRFKPSGSSSYVFARSVSGFKGVPFLTDALSSLTVGDFSP